MSSMWEASRVKVIQLCFVDSFCWPMWDLLHYTLNFLADNYTNIRKYFSPSGSSVGITMSSFFCVINLFLDKLTEISHTSFPFCPFQAGS